MDRVFQFMFGKKLPEPGFAIPEMGVVVQFTYKIYDQDIRSGFQTQIREFGGKVPALPGILTEISDIFSAVNATVISMWWSHDPDIGSSDLGIA